MHKLQSIGILNIKNFYMVVVAITPLTNIKVKFTEFYLRIFVKCIKKLNLTEKISMYMLDIYHVMMALYDISKCVIERLEVILCNYLKVSNIFLWYSMDIKN